MKKLPINLFDDWANLESLRTPELALDIETTGLDPWDADLRLIQVYLPSLSQVAVLDTWTMTEVQEVWLKRLLEVLDNSKVIKYIQNSVFDALWFRVKFDLKIRNIRDTRLMSQILKAGLYTGYKFELKTPQCNSLEYLCKEFGLEHDKTEQKSDWSTLELTKEQLRYAATDPVTTYYIGKIQYQKLVQNQPEVLEAEMGCIPAFIELIYRGLPVGDIDKAEFIYISYQKVSKDLETKLSTLMPEDPHQAKKIEEYWENPIIGKKGKPIRVPKPKPFNPGSSVQISEYIRLNYGSQYLLIYDTKTKEYKESSGKENLFLLREKFPESQEIRDLINYRGISKATSTLAAYLESIRNAKNRNCIQTTFSILATQGMGRSSSGDQKRKDIQNSQNFSKHLPSHNCYKLPPIRSMVSARKGYELLEIDLAASHLQFARILSGDRNLQKAKDENLKVHYITLASMLKFEGMNVTPYEAKELVEKKSDKQSHYKHLYKLSKTVIYSFLNYSGAARLQQSFYGYELSVSLHDCKNYLEACAEAYADLRAFQNQIYSKAQNSLQPVYVQNQETGLQEFLGIFGYSETLDGGLIWHKAQPLISQYGRQYNKLKISDVVSCQWLRPEATVMKNSLGIIDELCQYHWGIDNARLVNFSHDSLMLEVRKEFLPEIAPKAVDVITEEMSVYIPDYEPEESWEDMVVQSNWGGVEINMYM